MIPMPMTPHHALNTLPINSISFQLLSHSLFHIDLPVSVLDAIYDAGSEILVVFSNTEIEEQVSARGVLDEEGEGGTGEVREAFYFGLNEWRKGDAVDMTGGVYDSNFDCCF